MAKANSRTRQRQEKQAAKQAEVKANKKASIKYAQRVEAASNDGLVHNRPGDAEQTACGLPHEASGIQHTPAIGKTTCPECKETIVEKAIIKCIEGAKVLDTIYARTA